MTKKTIHVFFNHKPAEVSTPMKTLFYDIYKDFRVHPNALPFVFLHFQCDDVNGYEVLNMLETRKVTFPGENMIVSRLRV